MVDRSRLVLRRTAPGLLPNLFNRLCDNSPFDTFEHPSAYTLTSDGLLDEIRRDLAYLFNATSLGELIDASACPLVAASCINFGMPPLAGGTQDWALIGHNINQAINRYEPRLIKDSVRLQLPTGPSAAQGGSRKMSLSAASHLRHFEIHAQLAGQPYPVAFTVQSAVDFATHRLTVLGKT